jgi:hypothetical protein
MAHSFVGAEADRLPWLKDDVKRPRRSSGWVVAFLAASAVAIIAALSFWLGMNGALRPSPAPEAQSQTKIDLPPVASEPVPLDQEAMPQVEPAPIPPAVGLPAQQDVRLEAPPVRRVAARRDAAAHRSHPASKSAAAPKKKSAADAKALKYANPWKSTGVSGRMVRVGAYSSMEKGKEAWSRLAILSPAIKQLPAVVTDIPSPTGRTLYWLQIGTTSQAHSEVLCQRMRAIGQRCVVVDLAGARKDSGNGRQPVGI